MGVNLPEHFAVLVRQDLFYLIFIKGDIRSNERINNFKASEKEDSLIKKGSVLEI